MTVQEMAQLINERVRISEAARVIGDAIDANPAACAPLLAQVGHQLLKAIEGKERQPS